MQILLKLRKKFLQAILPTLRRVVIASVAMLRLTSVIRFSRSKLQVVTDMGWVIATLFRVRTAANLRVGRGELRNSCRTKKMYTVLISTLGEMNF